MGRLALAAAVAGFLAGAAGAETRLLSWSDLDGWRDDDHEAARATFLVTCGDLKNDAWRSACDAARTSGPARAFFEAQFLPVLVTDASEGLFTGYYEPELVGSRTRTEAYRYPLHRRPHDLPSGEPWFTREDIDSRGALRGRSLELAWLADPVDKFFLQVQGSGRIRLEDGTVIRLGFDGKNGHPYRSVGREMVRLGLLEPHRASAARIRSWVRDNPEDGMRLLWHNKSYVFFRELPELEAHLGPLGAMNRPVTAGRSLAVDPAFVPLGAPVWIEMRGRPGYRRLMVAQDTGAAIKGAQRGDIFFGSGATAGKIAGATRAPGRMVVLLPKAVAIKATGNQQ